jgi:hypothetical protein
LLPDALRDRGSTNALRAIEFFRSVLRVSLGALARKLLGHYFPLVGRMYRRFFVDLEKVAMALPDLSEANYLLDIGSGDGEVMNHVLRRQPGLRAVMIDIVPHVGDWLTPELRSRVEIFADHSVQDFTQRALQSPDAILLSDVMHHVPLLARAELLADIRTLLAGRAATIVIKDIEPGSARAKLAYLADIYITGDKAVCQVSRAEMRSLVQGVFPEMTCYETDLYQRDGPNYCLVFSTKAPTGNHQNVV